MFVNKISGLSKINFKGYQHVKNDVGENVMRFNYPYDDSKETCEIHFYRAIPTDNYNYKIVETPLSVVKLSPEGVDVNLQDLTNLDRDETFAYKVVKKDKVSGKVLWEGPDTGVKMKPEKGEFVFRVNNDTQIRDVNGVKVDDYQDPISNYKYTLVSRKGTTPLVQGAGYLITPDSFLPGAKYRGFEDKNTGKIYYDEHVQKNAEATVKTFSNVLGGSLAGPQSKIPYLKNAGYKYVFSTPIANGSKAWSLGYWNKNNMQVSSNMGNPENFASFFRDLYSNGMKYVYDGTFTSEGLEGIHFQYALRWADQKPQSYYWFRMSGLKDSNLGLGVIPKNKENLRHRLVNAPYNYVLQSNGTYKKVVNPNYDESKETKFQIYDASQASKEQIMALDKAIENYDNIVSGNALAINDHNDTIINYVFQVDPKEYDNRINIINELNKKFGKNINLDTPDGTIMVGQFSNFKIDKKTEGGFVTWDANTDMAKMNYHISGYDEKLLQGIVSPNERDYERNLIERGAREVQDLAIQSGKYWTGKVKDIQTLYTAQTVGRIKTTEDIENLISNGKLPEEARLSYKVLNNILNGEYLLAPKGVMVKDDVTVQSLMRLPLDSLELADNTVGVLSTSFFSNRATTDETLGLSRFDLMKQNNPHLVEPYSKTYNKVDSLFNNELKNLADEVINKVNETSNEKLLDSYGEYTEYGEYVMNLIGQDITKYVFLKSLGGEGFKTKLLDNGEITYDYDAIKETSSLKSLGINGYSPEDEALKLEAYIEKGIKKISSNDISYLADAINKKIVGTDTSSFRIAEAMVERSGLGLDWRLDAAKDVMDMDAIRNEDNSFDDNWNDVIAFWSRFVQGVKSENSNAYVVAEITDIQDLMKDNYGTEACPYKGMTNVGQKFNGEPDAMAKFFNETGISSEAGYSYFFTDLLKVLSPSFDLGNDISPEHNSFKARFDLLLQTRSVDYLRNLYTFMGNHDKPRLIHGLALDMELFHSNLLHGMDDFSQGRKYRLDAAKVLSGAKTEKDVPIEVRLMVDNNDYFLTASNKAIAMSKLLMGVVYEDLDGIASKEDQQEIIKALLDLTNGNYLGVGSTEKLNKINIKALSSLENAFSEVLSIAESNGMEISNDKKLELLNAVVNKANSKDLTPYLVQGDFNWQVIPNDVRQQNISYGNDLLGEHSDYKQYSLYTVQLARLLRDAYKETGMELNSSAYVNDALKEFAKKYTKTMVDANTQPPKKIEDPSNAMRKNGYAARDIRLAISMAIKQAEFKTGRTIENKQAIIDTVYKSATEPAVVKASMIMEFLKALPGIPTTYAGDEMGATGYEEKAKNVYLQNRNALPWSDLEQDNMIGDYRNIIMDSINGAIKDRSNPELKPLNNGTPYALDVQAHSLTHAELQQRIWDIDHELDVLRHKPQVDSKIEDQISKLEDEKRMLTKDFAKIAYMMQSANGDVTVSLFNAGDIEFSNRFDYFAKEKYGVDLHDKNTREKFFKENNIESLNPDNKYIPISPKSELDAIILGAGLTLPIGTVFMNANAKDKVEYVVKDLGGRLAIARKDGAKIVMDGITSKNGVMILKKMKNIVFKGTSNKVNEYNHMHNNTITNPYNAQQVEKGNKLSIVAR